jgi:hypothetical protein
MPTNDDTRDKLYQATFGDAFARVEVKPPDPTIGDVVHYNFAGARVPAMITFVHDDHAFVDLTLMTLMPRGSGIAQTTGSDRENQAELDEAEINNLSGGELGGGRSPSLDQYRDHVEYARENEYSLAMQPNAIATPEGTWTWPPSRVTPMPPKLEVGHGG